MSALQALKSKIIPLVAVAAISAGIGIAPASAQDSVFNSQDCAREVGRAAENMGYDLMAETDAPYSVRNAVGRIVGMMARATGAAACAGDAVNEKAQELGRGPGQILQGQPLRPMSKAQEIRMEQESKLIHASYERYLTETRKMDSMYMNSRTSKEALAKQRERSSAATEGFINDRVAYGTLVDGLEHNLHVDMGRFKAESYKYEAVPVDGISYLVLEQRARTSNYANVTPSVQSPAPVRTAQFKTVGY